MKTSARAFVLACLFCLLQGANAMAQKPHVSVDGNHYNIEGQPKFLIFVSYMDGWRAPRLGPCNDPNVTSLQCDFQWLKQIGFDGVRIFPNWLVYTDLNDPTWPRNPGFGDDTLFTPTGLRPGRLNQLKEILDAAGAAGLVVDLTFTRDTVCGTAPSATCPDDQRMSFANYKAAVVETLSALANESERFSHVIVDLQNERNLTGPTRVFQHLEDAQVAELAGAIRVVGGPISQRLTASIATPSAAEVANSVAVGSLNMAAWHDERSADWYSQTQARVVDLRTHLTQIGINVPISLQEPKPWQEDRDGDHMKIAVQGAKQACAASWTLHTRTAFNLTNSSFQRRLELDLPQRDLLTQLKAAANAVNWGCPQPPLAPRIITVDVPTSNQTARQPFLFGGWAIDTSSPTGTGVDTVHVWAFNAAGTGFFVGAAYGDTRPDVGAIYGSRFTNSGYSMGVRGLAQGTYTFTAFAHSTVTNAFDITKTVSNVTILTNPILTVDAPAANATVMHSFFLGGWAIDYAAASGTGVSTLHVWAYPVSGGPAVFVGVAPYGSDRSDVGAVYGPQFTNSGFNMIVNTLPSGTWDLALFPYSTLNNSFFPATVRRVTVWP